MDCPRIPPSPGPAWRNCTSGPPPAAYGEITRTGRLGKSLARTSGSAAAARLPARKTRLSMVLSPCRLSSWGHDRTAGPFPIVICLDGWQTSGNHSTPGNMHDFDPQRLLSRLRFKHLQLLLALHQGGSLRAAAGLMHLTQPAQAASLVQGQQELQRSEEHTSEL